MKIFLMICWRNLWRHKRRSLVVISSVALGIFAMLISLGILNGVMTQMVDNTISTSLGHISLQKKGFRDNMRLEYSFMPDETVKKALGGEKIRIRAFAPRVKVQGMIRSSERLARLMRAAASTHQPSIADRVRVSKKVTRASGTCCAPTCAAFNVPLKPVEM